jgi:hypothetical protein
MTVAPARTPARALIANAEARDRQAMLIGKLLQPQRKLRTRLRRESLSILERKAVLCQGRTLTQHPIEMTPRERVGLAARSAARDRHAHAPVVFDAQQIPPRPPVADEIDGGNRFGRCRRDLGFDGARKRQTQLHGDRIPDSYDALDTPSVQGVIFIALVRGT